MLDLYNFLDVSRTGGGDVLMGVDHGVVGTDAPRDRGLSMSLEQQNPTRPESMLSPGMSPQRPVYVSL